MSAEKSGEGGHQRPALADHLAAAGDVVALTTAGLVAHDQVDDPERIGDKEVAHRHGLAAAETCLDNERRRWKKSTAAVPSKASQQTRT